MSDLVRGGVTVLYYPPHWCVGSEERVIYCREAMRSKSNDRDTVLSLHLRYLSNRERERRRQDDARMGRNGEKYKTWESW